MIVGILSDTHDNVAAVELAIEAFDAAGVTAILHCGDVIAPPVIPLFDGYEFHLVFGNNDGEEVGLRSAVAELDPPGQCHGRFGVIEFDGMRIAALHGEDLDEVEQYAQSEAFDLVCHGHHHETRLETFGDTTVLNPGAHFPLVPGEHRQVALLDTADRSIDFVPID